MQNEFLNYDLSVELIKLGFDKKCLAWYNFEVFTMYGEDLLLESYCKDYGIIAPLWQQAFDFIRTTYFLVPELNYIDHITGWVFSIEHISTGKIVDESNSGADLFLSYEDCRTLALNCLIKHCEDRLSIY